MNPLEIAAAGLGLVNVVLLVRRSVWNFAFGMGSVALLGFVLAEARLFSEAGLQAFFFVVQGYGWWLWHRAARREPTAADEAVPVSWLAWPARGVWAAATAVLSLSLGWMMARFTTAVLPFADSAITGASIAAQFLLTYRKVENWVLWVAIDTVSIPLFAWRGLWFASALYVVYFVLSAVGLREWIRAARKP